MRTRQHQEQEQNETHHGLNRRELLRTLSGGALGLTAAGLLAGCGAGGGSSDFTGGGGNTNPGGSGGNTNPGGNTNGGNTSGGGGGNSGGSGNFTDFPNTKIADENTSIGYSLTPFHLGSQKTLSLRFVPRYKAQGAIITPDQANAFKNNQAFTGYGLFDGKVGMATVTLGAGDYFMAMRSTSSGANQAHFEIDTRDGLNPSDGYGYGGSFILNAADHLDAGRKIAYPFTITAGPRYFLIGCNTGGLDTFVIQATQKDAFLNGSQFTYYKDYSGQTEPDIPYYELHLAPGNYLLAIRNNDSQPNSYTFEGEYWVSGKAAPRPSAAYGSEAWRIPQTTPRLAPAISKG
jgi:hypothetical protein